VNTVPGLDVARDGNDALVARFTYAPGCIDAVAVQERDPPAPSRGRAIAALAMARLRRAGLNSDTDFGDANEVMYYHQNTLFSVYALSDASGSVMERYRFDAYGGCTVLDPDGSVDADGLSDVKNPYAFTGRRLDPESGLMQYRHRYYSPALGRFISRDPVWYDKACLLYGYVSGRPTYEQDPLGLWGISPYSLRVIREEKHFPFTISVIPAFSLEDVPKEHRRRLELFYAGLQIQACIHRTRWKVGYYDDVGAFVSIAGYGLASFRCVEEKDVPKCPPRSDLLLHERKCYQNTVDWRWCRELINVLHWDEEVEPKRLLICYREHPCGEQRRSQQCCYHADDGTLHSPSPDIVSPVEPGPGKGRDANGYCVYGAEAMGHHLLQDVIPGLAVKLMEAAIEKGIEAAAEAIERAREQHRR